MRVGRGFTLAAATAAGVLMASGSAFASQTDILETGSSLLYPLFNLWVPAYAKHHPDVKITTQSTGSGTGISQSIAKIAQIGASDAYLANAQMKAHPDMVNIPMAISSQMVNYNVPGLNGKHLKLSGPILSAIYRGKVTYWDAPMIAKANAGVKLPHKRIVPVHRSDGSGDTFLFTQYLTFSAPSWKKSVSYGTTVSWPAVSGEIGAQGNQGMVNAVKGTPYSVAYIGVSFKKSIKEAHLGEARLRNRAGHYVLPEVKTVQAAVKATASKTPSDERISLIFAPGTLSYPIINYEYAIIASDQGADAKELKHFLRWAISPHGGNAPHFMKAVNFVPLPHAIASLSEKQIAKIH